jgi:hypothetical protein
VHRQSTGAERARFTTPAASGTAALHPSRTAQSEGAFSVADRIYQHVVEDTRRISVPDIQHAVAMRQEGNQEGTGV